jgi:hypothetical protein
MLDHIAYITITFIRNSREYKIIAFLEIIHRPVSYLKQRFGDWILSSSTRSGKKPYSDGPNRKELALSTGPTWTGYYLTMKTEFSLRNVVLNGKSKAMVMSKTKIIVQIYHRHKLLKLMKEYNFPLLCSEYKLYIT